MRRTEFRWLTAPMATRRPSRTWPAKISDTRASILTSRFFCSPRKCVKPGSSPIQLSKGNLRDLYWSLAQLLTHHASSGCNLRPGDLLATGTISGPEEGSEGCLLEMKHRKEPLRLPTGETRAFLEDGDLVTLRGYCERPGFPRIGFGECAGKIIPAGVAT